MVITRSHGPLVALVLSLGVGGALCACGDTRSQALEDVLRKAGCDPAVVVETDGHRRLALLVGVGQYRKEGIPDLPGPPNDARRFYELLTGMHGYGFPKENVCLLLDSEATTERFKAAFEKSLVGRARSGDVAVFFYAGHGSQAPDRNRDEPDEWDETFMLHDTRTGGVRDLLDDELNGMLARLHEKTRYLTVVIDSCNSGTATRAPEASTALARFFTPDEPPAGAEAGATGGGDGAEHWVPRTLPGAVILTAATDSNAALEKNGRGIFTDALVRVLSDVRAGPLTYAQVARQVPVLVAAESPQVPYFHGELSLPVFGNESRTRPVAWEVRRLGPPLELSGPPLPGVGEGAELRVYDGAATGADTRDPGKSKATVVVTRMKGLNAEARVAAATGRAPAVVVGDLALLVRPADSFTTLQVRIRPATEPGGVPLDQAARVRRLVQADPEAHAVVQLTEAAGDFELGHASGGRLVLRGPENRIRNTYEDELGVPRSLWQHARQRALLQLRGEGGGDFVDNETLQATVVPAPANQQSACARGVWEQGPVNGEQVVPLCHTWSLRVRLADSARVPLLVGALILSTDGSLFALPADERKVRLRPGESVTFGGRNETFMGAPPLDAQDRIIVFGTQETNPVSWSLFTETAATRSARSAPSGLQRAIDRYLRPGTRGVSRPEAGPTEDTPWTLSTVTLRVEANGRFLEGGEGGEPVRAREYSLARFDVRPYLPDDPEAALYRVLKVADSLAQASLSDGYGYKQHAWVRPTDEQNLRLGIDCSRAIWFAFTRAGLSYNRGNRYLTTATMVGSDSAMQDEFLSCTDDPHLRLGDVLVYRDDSRGDGHVVMVIDPEKRIAWGSHGWDGTPRDLPVEPDTGVEYQKIKYKADWRRWDRHTMERKACWRHRAFEEQRVAERGVPGVRALENVCDSRRGCGRQ